MGKSNIEWTDATWNPWQGCTKVSAGCKNCYMYREKKMYGQNPTEVVRSKTVFVKQINLEGKVVKDIEEFPYWLRVREFPV